MNVLYLTNADSEDKDVIPKFITTCGDKVISIIKRFDVNFIKKNKIEFVVLDKARFLITKDIIDFLPKKIINLHPSYLPWARGYYPNYWSIRKKIPFGVTIHFVDEGIDSGDILVQVKSSYSENDTLRHTYYRSRELMINMFKANWEKIKMGKIRETKQNKFESNTFYKKDFDGIFAKLPNGWDTKIKDIYKVT